MIYFRLHCICLGTQASVFSSFSLFQLQSSTCRPTPLSQPHLRLSAPWSRPCTESPFRKVTSNRRSSRLARSWATSSTRSDRTRPRSRRLRLSTRGLSRRGRISAMRVLPQLPPLLPPHLLLSAPCSRKCTMSKLRKVPSNRRSSRVARS